MRGIGDYAVVYDISDARERRRVDKVLKGFGFRIQRSVFECRLNQRMRAELLEKLKEVEPKTGFVKVYRLEYSLKNESFGGRKHETLDSGSAFVI